MVLLPGFQPGAAAGSESAAAPLPVAAEVPELEAELELTAVPPQPAASSAAASAAAPVSSALRGILLEVNSVAFQRGPGSWFMAEAGSECVVKAWLVRRLTCARAAAQRSMSQPPGVSGLLDVPAVRMTVHMHEQTIE